VSDRLEIRFGGFGGQGVVTAGELLGRAANLDGKEAVLTKAYGPEIRGASVTADVIIDSTAIDYPHSEAPDLLVCFSQDAYDRLSPGLRPDGRIFFDDDLVRPATGLECYPINALRAAKALGNRVAANIVMLGFLAEVTAVVGRESLERAMLERMPEKVHDLNRQALAAGFEHPPTVV
jgi:2-oxoglutarate ferredoxin oxidoreductase subunit gamma